MACYSMDDSAATESTCSEISDLEAANESMDDVLREPTPSHPCIGDRLFDLQAEIEHQYLLHGPRALIWSKEI